MLENYARNIRFLISRSLPHSREDKYEFSFCHKTLPFRIKKFFKKKKIYDLTKKSIFIRIQLCIISDCYLIL